MTAPTVRVSNPTRSVSVGGRHPPHTPRKISGIRRDASKDPQNSGLVRFPDMTHRSPVARPIVAALVLVLVAFTRCPPGCALTDRSTARADRPPATEPEAPTP